MTHYRAPAEPPDERITPEQESEMRLGGPRYCTRCNAEVELWITKAVGPPGWREPPVYLHCVHHGVIAWEASTSTRA